MKVRFFYQHFWPDSPPYANMLRSIGAHLVKQGHQVKVLTGQPSYRNHDLAAEQKPGEVVDGINVKRIRSFPGAAKFRILSNLQKVLFPIRATFNILMSRLSGNADDVIVAATIPPVVNGLCALVAARLTGAMFVYHMQDIYPEVGVCGGLWSKSSFRYRFLKYTDSFVTRHADRCIVLSDDMKSTLLDRGVNKNRVVVIQNIMLSSNDTGSSLNTINSNNKKESPFRIIFAGNLGRFQGLENIVEGFKLFDERFSDKSAIELLFLGDGVAREGLIEYANKHPRIEFRPFLPVADAQRCIEECDAGIVSLAPDIYRYAYPSKTMTYLGLGLPLFVVIEEHSNLAVDVVKYDLGVVADRSPESIAESLERLLAWLQTPSADQKRILEHYQNLYSTETTLTRWDEMLFGLNVASDVAKEYQ